MKSVNTATGGNSRRAGIVKAITTSTVGCLGAHVMHGQHDKPLILGQGHVGLKGRAAIAQRAVAMRSRLLVSHCADASSTRRTSMCDSTNRSARAYHHARASVDQLGD